jgi:hypothetical protein
VHVWTCRARTRNRFDGARACQDADRGRAGGAGRG